METTSKSNVKKKLEFLFSVTIQKLEKNVETLTMKINCPGGTLEKWTGMKVGVVQGWISV